MVKKITNTHERSKEIIIMGKQGHTMLSEVAKVWGCSTQNVTTYLHRLQEKENYAYLVDGKGYFRIFMDFK